MTSSIRNLVDAGRTKPETRLITISTKPTASRPRRGRINSQTSGKIAFRRSILGGFVGSLAGELNVLFDSAGPGFASLLLHCHTSGSGTPCRAGCDRQHGGVVCSGRAPATAAGALAHLRPIAGVVYHAGCSACVLRLHDVAGHGPAATADGTGGPQPQRFAAIASHPERSQPAGGCDARHGQQR